VADKPKPFFPPPTFDSVPDGGRLKITRPNKNGEVVVEGSVPPSRFRESNRPEEVISLEAKARILAGERPGLVWDGETDPPVEVGDEIAINRNVWITILRLTKTKGGDHRARYLVSDWRPTIPRHLPRLREAPELDRYGRPIPPSKEATEAATLDGNYCETTHQAVPEIAEEVDVKYRRGLGVSAKVREARRKRMEKPEKEAARDLAPLVAEMREIGKRAVKLGLDPAPFVAPIARQIEEAHRELSAKAEERHAA
jgi:hypothetical protein